MTEFDYSNDQFDKKTGDLLLRKKIYDARDLDALVGKTANALSASLNIQLKIFSKLATAQSIDDVRNAALIAAPLMTRVSGMLERGELLSVQAAQGMSDEDTIIEAWESMTQVARVIKSGM
jgi:hypothetical protein